MNTQVIFLVFTLFACVFGQVREDKLTIDPFEPSTAPLVVLIDDQDLPMSDSTSTVSEGILGGERDLQITAESGPDNLLLTTSVNNGLWSVATPNSARGFALMQYDGVDNSMGLREGGLGGVDLTSGSADSFRLLIQSDIETLYTFTVYGNNGGSSTFDLEVPGDDTTNEYFLAFDDFSGGVDFRNVGAIEILVEAFDNVDTFVEVFKTTGFVVSPSPSPSFIPPPPPEVPSQGTFTWYTFDDDDNGRSPCGDEEPRKTYFVNDENIIYYYFYGFDPVYEESSSDAAILKATTAVLSCFIALLFAM